jgi:hypothetical protein
LRLKGPPPPRAAAGGGGGRQAVIMDRGRGGGEGLRSCRPWEERRRGGCRLPVCSLGEVGLGNGQRTCVAEVDGRRESSRDGCGSISDRVISFYPSGLITR